MYTHPTHQSDQNSTTITPTCNSIGIIAAKSYNMTMPLQNVSCFASYIPLQLDQYVLHYDALYMYYV